MNRAIWAGLNNPKLDIDEADAVVLGLPFDGAASYRKGAAQAPDRIRSISTHTPHHRRGPIAHGFRVARPGKPGTGHPLPGGLF